MACAGDIASGRGRITISMPNLTQSVRVRGICIAGLYYLDLTSLAFPDGPNLAGLTQVQNAFLLTDFLNNNTDSAVLVDARTTRGMVAVQNGSILTIELDVDEAWCDGIVVVFHTKTGGPTQTCGGPPLLLAYQPFVGRVSEVQCACPCLDCVNCDDYPDDAYVFRFLFHDNEPIGDRTGPDVAYTLQLGDQPCYQWDGDIPILGILYNYWPGNNPLALSYWDYGQFSEFCDGWAAWFRDVWNHDNFLYSVTHLGGGLMEVVASRIAWGARGIDLEAVGFRVCELISATGYGEHYEGEFVGELPEVVAEQACIGDEGPVIIINPPVITDPPVLPPYVIPDTVPPACLEDWTMEACRLSTGGVRRLWVMDYRFLVATCRDDTGRITAIDAPGGLWAELDLKDVATVMEVTEEDADTGVRHLVRISCFAPRMSQGNRNTLHTLRPRRLCVIVLDGNGLYWFVGHKPFPARVRALSGTTEARGGSNRYQFNIEGYERTLPREVAAEVVEGDGYNPGIPLAPDCGQYVGAPMGPLTEFQLANCELDTLKDNDLV